MGEFILWTLQPAKSSIMNHIEKMHPEEYTAKNISIINSIGRMQRSKKYQLRKATIATKKIIEGLTPNSNSNGPETSIEQDSIGNENEFPTLLMNNELNQTNMSDEQPKLNDTGDFNFALSSLLGKNTGSSGSNDGVEEDVTEDAFLIGAGVKLEGNTV